VLRRGTATGEATHGCTKRGTDSPGCAEAFWRQAGHVLLVAEEQAAERHEGAVAREVSLAQGELASEMGGILRTQIGQAGWGHLGLDRNSISRRFEAVQAQGGIASVESMG
jgi:hypothetical protein